MFVRGRGCSGEREELKTECGCVYPWKLSEGNLCLSGNSYEGCSGRWGARWASWMFNAMLVRLDCIKGDFGGDIGVLNGGRHLVGSPKSSNISGKSPFSNLPLRFLCPGSGNSKAASPFANMDGQCMEHGMNGKWVEWVEHR